MLLPTKVDAVFAAVKELMEACPWPLGGFGRAEAGVDGGCHCREETTSMATMEAISTTTMCAETYTIDCFIVGCGGEEQGILLVCREMEIAWIHAYRMEF